jgi:hypothetical protein
MLSSNRQFHCTHLFFPLAEQTKKELEENEVKEVSIFDSKVTVLQGHSADVRHKYDIKTRNRSLFANGIQHAQC